MRITLLLLGLLFAFNAASMCLFLPEMVTEGMLPSIGNAWLVSSVVLALGKLMSMLVLHRRRGILEQARTAFGAAITTPAFYGLLIGVLAAWAGAQWITRNVGFPGMPLLLSSLLLLTAGIFLARRFGDHFVPVLFAASLSVLLSVVSFVLLVIDPEAIGRFGPERIIFAWRDFVGDTAIILPLSASTVWSAWLVARSMRAQQIAPANAG